MADPTLSGVSISSAAGTLEPLISATLTGEAAAFSGGSLGAYTGHILRVDLPVEPIIRIDLEGISQEGILVVTASVDPVTTVIIPTALRQTHVLVMADSTMQLDIPAMAVSQGVALQVPDVSPVTTIDPMAVETWPLLAVPDVAPVNTITLGGIIQTHLLAIPSNTLQTAIPDIVMYLPDICPSPSSSLEQIDQVLQWSSDTGYPDQTLNATSQSFRLTLVWEQIELEHKNWIEGYCRGNAQNEFLYTYVYDGWNYNCVIEEFPKVSHATASQRVDVSLVLRGYRVP